MNRYFRTNINIKEVIILFSRATFSHARRRLSFTQGMDTLTSKTWQNCSDNYRQEAQHMLVDGEITGTCCLVLIQDTQHTTYTVYVRWDMTLPSVHRLDQWLIGTQPGGNSNTSSVATKCHTQHWLTLVELSWERATPAANTTKEAHLRHIGRQHRGIRHPHWT